MADTKKKRPRDISQRAKLVVDIATGKIEDRDEARSAKSPAPDGVADGDGFAEQEVLDTTRFMSALPCELKPIRLTVDIHVDSATGL